MLFDPDIRLKFTPDQWAVVTRLINGGGGSQGLLRKLLKCQTGQCQLTVPYVLVDKAYYYLTRHGPGGYQDRFQVVCDVAEGTGKWSPADLPKRPPPKPDGGAFGRKK